MVLKAALQSSDVIFCTYQTVIIIITTLLMTIYIKYLIMLNRAVTIQIFKNKTKKLFKSI